MDQKEDYSIWTLDITNKSGETAGDPYLYTMKLSDLLMEDMSPEEIRAQLRRAKDLYETILKTGTIELDFGVGDVIVLNYSLPDEYKVYFPDKEKRWYISPYRHFIPHIEIRADQCNFSRIVDNEKVRYSFLYVRHHNMFEKVREKFMEFGVYLEDSNKHIPNG